jgi:predicted glycogen debranching enzyme
MRDLTLGRDQLGDLSVATEREWLVTNGIGGFAAGTVSGALTRRHHGLLIAALEPPLRRTLLLAKLAERVGSDGDQVDLTTDLWASGAVEPRGHRHLLSFQIEGTIPVWTWAVPGARLEKRVWMETGENTTCIEYALGADGGHAVTLSLQALVDHRDLHALTVDPPPAPAVERTERGWRVRMYDTAAPLYLSAAGAELREGGTWFRDYALTAERELGSPWMEDHFLAGEFVFRMLPGERCLVVASTRPGAVASALAAAAARSRHLAHERELLDAWRGARPVTTRSAPRWVERLVLAADAFVVARPSGARPHGRTILAAYPEPRGGLASIERGRDAMGSLAGLTLATGRPELAREILLTWAAHADRALIPHRFTEPGGQPDYHSVDASLWLFQAVRAYHEATGDDELLDELFATLEDIGAWFERGDRHGIAADPRDGLIRAGGEGMSRTWMDARADGEPVTPRAGKPVEVNALWFNALTAMTAFARRLGQPDDAYADMARRVGHAFERFWNPETGCLFDVIDGPQGPDPSVRPNQIFAVSLPDTPLAAARRRAVLERCTRRLAIPFGLRTLSPEDDGYRAHYAGTPAEKEACAHTGSAWVWLLPHYALAHYRVHGDRAAALAVLEPLGELLELSGIGFLPEMVEGAAPHAPRGAIAHAWAVGEALRVWHALASAPPRRPIGRGRRTLSLVGAK